MKRAVYVFGAAPDFDSMYREFFEKYGFEMCFSADCPDTIDEANMPVLLVFGVNLDEPDEEVFWCALGKDRRLPVIYIDCGQNSPGLRKKRERARYAFKNDFKKKELLTALKGCSEILGTREKLEVVKGELKVKSAELAYVLEIGKALASSIELPKVLGKIMDRMNVLVNAESWAVFLMDQLDNELALEAAKGLTQKKIKAFRMKLDEGIAGWCASDVEPKLVNKVSTEKRFFKKIEKIVGVKAKSVMAIPIVGSDNLLGVIELVNKADGRGFNQSDLDLATRLVDQTAIAIERAQMYQKMADLVITDDLTKLFNMRYLERTLEIEIERALRYNLSCSLIFMDVDYFKKVNDRHGHLVGSRLLVEVSQLLLKGLRRIDIIARYGGDEFIIVLPQTDVEAARMIADRLRISIEKHTFLKSEGLSLKLTASFGIACFPEHAGSKEELIKLADEAMYRVKYHTRNDVYVVNS
ncbi:MAG TPA: sensor domain-containing diguanylate cyclase [Nitrospirota bacterium]